MGALKNDQDVGHQNHDQNDEGRDFKPEREGGIHYSLSLKQNPQRKLRVLAGGDPNGIRTRVNAVKGRRPRPLNDGAEKSTEMLTTES